MHYKGENKTLGEVEIGSPVEITKEDEFILTQLGERDEKPVVGILTQLAPTYDGTPNVIPVVNVPVGDLWKKVQGKHGMPKEAKVLRVLTGNKASAIKLLSAKGFTENLVKNPGFTLGCDPEIFVEHKNGMVFPAFEFLPNRSRGIDAVPIDRGLYDQGKVYWDGFQAEFTTPPHSCYSNLCDYIRAGLETVLFSARKVDPDARLSVKTVLDIHPDVMMNALPEHVALGCSPSRNAYQLKGQYIPDPSMLPFRCVGGHIHLGFQPKRDEEDKIVRTMDAILGVCLTGAFAGYEDVRRRSLYGLAGEYRRPPHGLEYRTLSPLWLIHPAVSHLTFDLARAAVWMVNAGYAEVWKADQELTIRAINECDGELARKIVSANKEVFLALTQWLRAHSVVIGEGLGDAKQYSNAAYKFVMEGLDAVLQSPKDFEKNWLLGAPKGKWQYHSEGENAQWNRAAIRIMNGEKV